jgi:hypothetical protein
VSTSSNLSIGLQELNCSFYLVEVLTQLPPEGGVLLVSYIGTYRWPEARGTSKDPEPTTALPIMKSFLGPRGLRAAVILNDLQK